MPDIPISPQQVEKTPEQHEAELSYNRAQARLAQKKADTEQAAAGAETQKMPVSFPKGMFILALGFDVIGLIPVVNLVSLTTEPVAAIIFGYWQKKYQDTDILTVLINVAAWKGLDAITIGILPSNTGLVARAYLKKKAQNMV